MDQHRLLSLLLVLASFGALAFCRDAEAIFSLGGGLLVSAALIWFPDELGSLTYVGGISRTSPGPFVRFFGWLFLLAGAVASFGTVLFGMEPVGII